MSDFVQIKNPKTGKYTKIDKEKGEIVSHKKTSGPYKGVPVAGQEEDVLDQEFEEFFDDLVKDEPLAGEFEEETEPTIINEKDFSPTPLPLVITKTFFDFTYDCVHGTAQHCKRCYKKARNLTR